MVKLGVVESEADKHIEEKPEKKKAKPGKIGKTMELLLNFC